MIESEFAEIFSDLLEEHDAEEQFLQALVRQVPGSGALLVLDEEEKRLSAGAGFALEPHGERSLLEAASGRESEGDDDSTFFEAVGSLGVEGGWVYSIPLPCFRATLLWMVPGGSDLSREPGPAALLNIAIHYARSAQQRQESQAQASQAGRQIEVLKQQHSRLIEDNYRQYRINQEKEQEYARKLESEISRQTAELRSANARLEESSRLKSEFLANMSHELRTPMNAIMGFAELLSETTLDGEQDEYCRTIRQSAASLLTLINDILDLAKIEAGRLDLDIVPFDLNELLEVVLAMFSLTTKNKGIKLRLHRDPGLPRQLQGDNHRLRQVLVNLTGNAVKFTQQGTVELRVERVEAGEAGDGATLRFSVRDSGIGIPAHRLDAIFEKFTQADGSTTRRFGGTGLGLAICRQLVELMGGEIQVESREGEGSTFSFVITLPVEQADQPKPAEAEDKRSRTGKKSQAGEGASPGDGKGAEAGGRILLVEDNPVNQRLASLMIGKQGYTSVVAGDGVEALERLEDEEFDLVLMDVQMPRMDGLSATREIRAIEQDRGKRGEYKALAGRVAPIPIVGLTAHARKEDEDACYAAGMSDFLTKPIIKGKLVEILSRYLDR